MLRCVKRSPATSAVATCRYFTGSESSPDDARLLKHLLDPDCDGCDLTTTPVPNNSVVMHVSMGIAIRKLIALVKPKNADNTLIFMHLLSLYIC